MCHSYYSHVCCNTKWVMNQNRLKYHLDFFAEILNNTETLTFKHISTNLALLIIHPDFMNQFEQFVFQNVNSINSLFPNRRLFLFFLFLTSHSPAKLNPLSPSLSWGTLKNLSIHILPPLKALSVIKDLTVSIRPLDMCLKELCWLHKLYKCTPLHVSRS